MLGSVYGRRPTPLRRPSRQDLTTGHPEKGSAGLDRKAAKNDASSTAVWNAPIVLNLLQEWKKRAVITQLHTHTHLLSSGSSIVLHSIELGMERAKPGRKCSGIPGATTRAVTDLFSHCLKLASRKESGARSLAKLSMAFSKCTTLALWMTAC
jgi:hypothetical protein